MKIRQLECFCALAETLNFTKAAQQIYMTQSAFSKNIASLERELGCMLITRSKVSPALTEAGTRIYARAKGIVRDAEEIQKIAGDARRGELLTIRIGLLWGGFHKEERNIFNSYIMQNENISFDINECSVNDLFQSLDFNTIDFAIYNGHWHSILEKYDYLAIQENPTCLICNEKHRFADREQIRFKELEGEAFIMVKQERSSIEREYLGNMCRGHGFGPYIKAEVDSVFILLDYVEQGIGTAIMGMDVLSVSRRDLRAIPILELEPSYHWFLSRKHDDRPGIRQFWEYVKKESGRKAE